jgi:hypothetical protein
MSPLFLTGKSPFWSGVMEKTRKLFRVISILIIVVGGSFIYWKYFYTYSAGYRAGRLQKFSSKGAIFKTYEGEMTLSGLSSDNSGAVSLEKFHFTLVNKALVRQFDTLQGEMVIVHYKQKNGKLFWRGDTEYLVDSLRLKR